MKHKFKRAGASLYCLLCSAQAVAQDIEPRRWTPLPVGMNLVGAGLAYTDGDIAFDPVLRVRDVTVEAKSTVVSYLHAFDLLGKSARVDVRLPFTRTYWKGLVDGEPRSTVRKGMADPRIRLSVNFLGAPALRGEAFRTHRAKNRVNTVAGAALAIRLPLGDYRKDKLLNLGENRFVFRPQLGIVHTRGPWSYELTASAFFYTDNNDFFPDKKREQDPLFALQAHLNYVAKRGWWASVGTAYDWGGESKIDGVSKDDRRQDLLFGISAGLPLSRGSGLKISYVGARRQTETGSETDSLAVAYSYRF